MIRYGIRAAEEAAAASEYAYPAHYASTDHAELPHRFDEVRGAGGRIAAAGTRERAYQAFIEIYRYEI